VNAPIRVVVVDDEHCRRAVCGWFADTDDILIAGEAQNGVEVLPWLCQVRPDVVLIDVNAAEAEQMRRIAACAGVIVLHGSGQEALVLDAFRAGALGHLDKQNIRPPQAVAAVRAVSRGEAVLSPNLAGRIVDAVAERGRKEK